MNSNRMMIFHSSPPFFSLASTFSLANKEKVIKEISPDKYRWTMRTADQSISYNFSMPAEKMVINSEYMPSSFFIPEMDPQATLSDRFPSSFFHMLDRIISRPSIPS